MTWKIARDRDRITVAGELRIRDAKEIWRTLREAAQPPAPSIAIDLTKASALDGTIMALVISLRNELSARGTRCEIVGASGAVSALVGLYGGGEPSASTPPRRARRGLIERLGAATADVLERGSAPATFFGDVLAAIPTMWQRPARSSWRGLPGMIARAGADGMPIVILLNFLVGFLFVFQSTPLLEMYGANIWAADLIGIAGTRELAPLITAVILSGRSGAAFAAQLGTMRVTEEIDALAAMGVSRSLRLVLPKVIALTLAMPLLVLWTSSVALIGGWVSALVELDISFHFFITALPDAVPIASVYIGLAKGAVFGLLIALIACHFGLRVQPNTESLSSHTTASVVAAITVVILADAVFAIATRSIGIPG